MANVTREGGCGKYGCLSGQRDREPGKESTQVERDLNRVNTPIDHRGVKAEQETAHCGRHRDRTAFVAVCRAVGGVGSALPS